MSVPNCLHSFSARFPFPPDSPALPCIPCVPVYVQCSHKCEKQECEIGDCVSAEFPRSRSLHFSRAHTPPHALTCSRLRSPATPDHAHCAALPSDPVPSRAPTHGRQPATPSPALHTRARARQAPARAHARPCPSAHVLTRDARTHAPLPHCAYIYRSHSVTQPPLTSPFLPTHPHHPFPSKSDIPSHMAVMCGSTKDVRTLYRAPRFRRSDTLSLQIPTSGTTL